jgi:hypothetical protein
MKIFGMYLSPEDRAKPKYRKLIGSPSTTAKMAIIPARGDLKHNSRNKIMKGRFRRFPRLVNISY